MFCTSLVILEDNADEIKLWIDTLSTIENIKIKAFTNPKEGLEYILENKPNIIVTDLIMPYIDGLHVATKAKEVYDPKIILFSNIALDIKKYAHSKYFDVYMPKPISLKELKEIVQIIKKEVCKRRITKFNKLVRSILEEVNCVGRDRLFLEDVIKLLAYDAIKPSDDNMYDVLSVGLKKDNSTIKRRIARIVEKVYEPTLFNKVLNIKDKPKPKMFVDALLAKTYKKAKEDV